MSFAAIAGGIGALLGGASAAGSAVAGGKMNRKNRRWQEKMYKQQLQDQRENSRMQWQESRDYAKWAYDNIESPAAQRAGFKAAGINPFVEGSVLQPMGASSGNVSSSRKVLPLPLRVPISSIPALLFSRALLLFVSTLCSPCRLRISKHRPSIPMPSV